MLNQLRSAPERLHLALMLALTFSTGIVDAVGYLGLDKVFAGNMTGNVVILGMALAGADDLPWIGPLLALFAFMFGAVVGGRVLRPVAAGWTTRTTWLFAVVGLVQAALAVSLFVTDGAPPQPWEYLITFFLAASMGIQAATARHIAVKDVTTVVVTSTITGFAADSRLAGGTGQPWFRRLAAIVLIAAGAAIGALLLQVHIGWGVGAAALVTVLAALLGHAAAHARHAAARSAKEGSIL
ncbi:YoaK family protein [Microbacterium sp. BR1]|uniref:YoaK family protein n=1 Tax=Microbacterium sp. BR1 TaxID=1070896 RepID=UPI001E3DB339|nr:YoaK family protein [Microbacterium sp. BR1]